MPKRKRPAPGWWSTCLCDFLTFCDFLFAPFAFFLLLPKDTHEEISLAKDPTICSCEYRNCEYLLRWRSLWGHEPHEGRAELRGGVHNTNEDDRSNYERLNAGESERE